MKWGITLLWQQFSLLVRSDQNLYVSVYLVSLLSISCDLKSQEYEKSLVEICLLVLFEGQFMSHVTLFMLFTISRDLKS